MEKIIYVGNEGVSFAVWAKHMEALKKPTWKMGRGM